jgi:hypothetical protein
MQRRSKQCGAQGCGVHDYVGNPCVFLNYQMVARVNHWEELRWFRKSAGTFRPVLIGQIESNFSKNHAPRTTWAGWIAGEQPPISGVRVVDLANNFACRRRLWQGD